MKRSVFWAAAAAITAAVILAGCLSYQVQSVTVSAEGNATAMNAGGTLQFSSSVVATGKDLTGSERVNWTVSSTEDGKGSVTPGTSISPSGLLKVSVDEIYPVIWVKAASAAYSRVYDFRQLQISGPKVGSVTLTSAGNAASVPAGGTLKFTAVAAGRGPNQGITFSVGSVSGVTGPVAAGTSIASDGTLTVAAGETANSLFVRAVSETDTTKTDTKEVKVVTVTSVTVTADGGTAKVVRGGSLQFSASVTGNNSPPNTVTWKVSANAAGTSPVTAGTSIASNGTLRVASDEAATTLYVTATSTINTAKSGTITVVIPTVTGVAITPASPQIKRGDGLSFKATVQGTGGPGQEVTWTVEGIGGNMTGSTMTGNGILTVTINEMLSRLLVTATSVDDPTKSGTATVTIAASPAGVPPPVPVAPVETAAPAATTTTTATTTTATTTAATTPAATASTAASADSNMTLGVYGNGYSITKYKGTNKEESIPSRIGGKSILSIEQEAFRDSKNLTKVTIPNTVTNIGNLAFFNCTGLTGTFTIPDSVTSIGEMAFAGCTSISTVTIGSGVTTIGSSPFALNTSLTAINVDSSNNTYSSVNGVLYNKNKTVLHTYPGGKKGAFTIPGSVTGIGYGAFFNCIGLTSVTIPGSVTSIGNSAFESCTALTSVTFEGAIPSANIVSNAFGYPASDLRDKYLAGGPGTYTRAGGSGTIASPYVWTKQGGTTTTTTTPSAATTTTAADSNFTTAAQGSGVSITGYKGSSAAVTIPSSIGGKTVLSIGEKAFYQNAKVTSVTIPNSVTSIGVNAFADCKILTSVTIPNSVTTIGDGVFASSPALTSITIPSSVTKIGDGAFGLCNSLTTITVDPANTAYTSQDGILYNKAKTTLLQYPGGKKAASFTIPNGVTSLGLTAFIGAQLTSLIIPNSFTKIADNDFTLTNIKSVTIPNSVTSIGNAFNMCSLTSITIPSSVTSIGSAFGMCGDLTSVTILGSGTKIDDKAFLLSFGSGSDLVAKYRAGGPGTYTRPAKGDTWTKQ